MKATTWMAAGAAAALALLVACGRSPVSGPGDVRDVADAAADAAPDPGREAGPGDPGRDGEPVDGAAGDPAGGADGGGDTPADLPGDAPGDAVGEVPGPDAPPVSCGTAPVPAWATVEGDAVTARCGAAVLHVSFPGGGVARLRHGEVEPRPSWALADPGAPGVAGTFGADGSDLVGCAEGVRVRVTADGCRATVVDGDGAVLLDDGPAGGFAAGPGGGFTLRQRAPAGECLYGLGGRTGALDRAGRAFTLRNTDAYVEAWGGWPVDADPLYTSVPFVIGLRDGRARGLWIDNTWRQSWDLGAAEAGTHQVAAAGGVAVRYVMAGPTPAEVLRRYTALTGRTPLWPRWTLGFQQSRWGYHPAGRFLEVCREFRTRRIPADGIWFDIQHQDRTRAWTWDGTGFPDPAGLLSDLADLGFKASLIQDPGTATDPAYDVYATGLAGGHFLEGPDGQPFVGAVWPGPSAFPDVSDPAARAWWGDFVPRATGVGARGIWLDMNEPTSFVAADGNTVPDAVAASGDGVATTMAEVHDAYALLESRATFEGWRRHVPGRRPYLLSRAGSAGIQRHATVWTGDAPSRWEVLRATVPMLLGMGMSGLAVVGSDVGGFSGGRDGELFARWMQVGTLSPFFRSHVTNGPFDQEPWAFGPEVEAVSRAVIQERYRLLPYWYALLDASTRTGAPLMRPLAFDFPGDPVAAAIGDQAMVGPWLMAAPVLEAGATTRRAWLPAGRWFEVQSGAVSEGPAWVTVGVTLAALPTWVREGAIVPRGPLVQWSDQAPLDPLFLDVYPAATATAFDLYEDDGDSMAYRDGAFRRVAYALQGRADGMELAAAAPEGTFAPPARRLEVRVHRVDHDLASVTLDGTLLPRADSCEALAALSSGWCRDAADLSLVAAFPDRAPFVLRAAYDPALAVPEPDVPVPFRVTVPPGTPRTSSIHVATSAGGWTHQPLAWVPDQDAAEGAVPVPRGTWFQYKITRGDWATVEKWPGCEEAANRYGFAAAHPLREDAVAAWADLCRQGGAASR